MKLNANQPRFGAVFQFTSPNIAKRVELAATRSGLFGRVVANDTKVYTGEHAAMGELLHAPLFAIDRVNANLEEGVKFQTLA